MMQPTNHGLQDHLWRYFSSLETRSSSGNNYISAVGDNHHQYTNPRFIMPSGGEHDHHEYSDSNNTDLQLSWGRSFITNNYLTAAGSDPCLSSSSSSTDQHMIRGLDPQMSSAAGSDQHWRLAPSSSLGYTPMLHHPLPIQTNSQTPLFTASKMEVLGSTHHGISTAGSLVTKRPAPAASFQMPEKSQTDAKKSRCSPMSRSTSCPVLKVRKEKLGDRIAALQKLVAPFGKTDTASVLTEAIGYIQFLHDQVQKLSVPYMKSTGSAVQVSSRQLEEGKEEQKADLQNRGLCLVPQSWASFFISSAGFGV